MESRLAPSLDDITVPAPPPGPADWNDDGVLFLPKLLHDARIDAYMAAWEQANGFRSLEAPYGGWSQEHGTSFILNADRPGGWPGTCPYMQHHEILDLVAPVAPHLESLLGEPGGMHLNLTGWVTTTRDWHQDSYLNEAEVGDYYAAVWIALGDIHPDSGPFQYVPGSHRWPQVTRDLIAPHVDMSDPHWPTESEKILSPLFAAEIERREADVVTYLPSRGDVLIWHGRLLHRGSIANHPGAYRPAFIAHFSGINHRPRMGTAKPYGDGGWYFPIRGGLV